MTRVTSRIILATGAILALASGCGDDGSGGSQGDATEAIDAAVGPRDIGLRLGNFVPGAGPVNACLAPDGADFVGPLAGDPGVAFRGATRLYDVSSTGTVAVRWVDGAATDCDTPLAGTTDDTIDLAGADQAIVALTDADGVSPSDDLQTRVLVAPPVDVPDDVRRFFARLWNLSLDGGETSFRQFDCSNPFAAFSSTAYGEPGFSPNNQGPVFSASVSIGKDDFTTDIVVCGDAEEALVDLTAYRFNKAELQFVIVSGNGTEEAPWDITRCIENEAETMDCETELGDKPGQVFGVERLLRLGHFAPGVGSVDICVAASESRRYEGPLLGNGGLQFREATRLTPIRVEEESMIRWVQGGAENCNQFVPGAADRPLGGEADPPALVALTDDDGVAATSSLTTRVLLEPAITIPGDSRDLFLRLWHLGREAAALSLKLGPCTEPNPALASSGYGEPGLTPAGQPVYTAPVPDGQDTLTTDVTVCDAASAPLVARSGYLLRRAETQLLVLSGDGTAAFPWDLTRCVDTDARTMDCTAATAP